MSDNGRRRMVWPGEKRMVLLKELMETCYKLGQLIFDAFIHTVSTAMVFQLLSSHMLLLGWEKKISCLPM